MMAKVNYKVVGLVVLFMLALFQQGVSEQFHVVAGQGSLLRAQQLVRAHRQAHKDLESNLSETHHVFLGKGRHIVPSGGFVLTAEDSNVVWHGETGSVIDGGVAVSGPWKPVNPAFPSSRNVNLWQAPAPASLLSRPDTQVVRNLWAGGVRLNRTRVNAFSVGLGPMQFANITDNGYRTTSVVPSTWADPASVELVVDDTWVQHRCRVTGIRGFLDTDYDQQQSCDWYGEKIPGSSPGSSVKLLNVSSWEGCQEQCCLLVNSTTPCRSVIFHDTINYCYLLDRPYGPNFVPEANSYVANLNGPPPPRAHAAINISQQCWDTARTPGYGQLTFPTFFENTGTFSTDNHGEWWLDRHNSRIIISMPTAPHDVVVGTEEVLVHVVEGTANITWQRVTFQHSTWYQAGSLDGFVERYANLYFTDGHKSVHVPPAAVMVAKGTHLMFDECEFVHLGSWGLRLYNGTQHTIVNSCSFYDLSGGSISIGNLNDTKETDPTKQTASIIIRDNTIQRIGVEYHGAPGLHTFCMRDSSIENNMITDVSYSGISYNWPNPQGPTLGPIEFNSTIGYSANNRIVDNDVSFFMRYMNDGGGIHTIGRSYNTTISGNYFHDLGSGNPGEHSLFAQSIIYIDNWSCFFNITNNVVVNCPHTKQGYTYFQGMGPNGALGKAHDNELDGLYLQNAGTLSGKGQPCNCTHVVTVPIGQPLPPAAMAIIKASGPRYTTPLQ